MKEFIIENKKFYNKNLFSHNGRINRKSFFINAILIQLSCLLIVTIPIAIILSFFNTKKRVFDITENENFSWISTFLFHVLGNIAAFICRGYVNSESSFYNQHNIFIISFIILILLSLCGLIILFTPGKHKPDHEI